MTIELPPDLRKAAIHSLERYSHEKMDDPIGNLQAAALLDFFLVEIGPLVFNRALEAAKEHMVARVMDVEGELYAEPFTYWRKAERPGKDR